MSYDSDLDKARDIELNQYLERTWVKVLDDPDFYDECRAERYEHDQKEFNDWLDAKEIND